MQNNSSVYSCIRCVTGCRIYNCSSLKREALGVYGSLDASVSFPMPQQDEKIVTVMCKNFNPTLPTGSKPPRKNWWENKHINKRLILLCYTELHVFTIIGTVLYLYSQLQAFGHKFESLCSHTSNESNTHSQFTSWPIYWTLVFFTLNSTSCVPTLN